MRRCRAFCVMVTAAFWLLLLRRDGAGYCLLLFLATAVHEFGHIVAAFLLRVPMSPPRLTLMGWKLEYDPSAVSYPAEAAVICGGPVFGLFAAVSVWLFGGLATAGGLFFAAACGGLSLWNLLPACGLDGGSFLRCVGAWTGRPETAERVLRVTGPAVALLLAALGVWIQMCLGGNLSILAVSLVLLFQNWPQKTAGRRM